MDTLEPCTEFGPIPEMVVVSSLQKHVRINKDTNTVEFYDDYGVKMVLRNLSEEELAAYSLLFRIYQKGNIK